MLLFFNSLNQGLLRERPLQLGHPYGLPRTAKWGLMRTLAIAALGSLLLVGSGNADPR
jgi:hypothetical protein